jgi:hypothetical protein
MALGRYASDLEEGDDLGSFEYVVKPFIVREYTHSVELHQAAFQEEGAWPPTLVHIDKLRFFKLACPGGTGPTARIHYEFRNVWSSAIRTGDRITASAKVAERATRKGRDYIVIEIELRSSDDGRLLLQYRDTAILSYRQAEQAA